MMPSTRKLIVAIFINGIDFIDYFENGKIIVAVYTLSLDLKAGIGKIKITYLQGSATVWKPHLCHHLGGATAKTQKL